MLGAAAADGAKAARATRRRPRARIVTPQGQCAFGPAGPKNLRLGGGAYGRGSGALAEWQNVLYPNQGRKAPLPKTQTAGLLDPVILGGPRTRISVQRGLMVRRLESIQFMQTSGQVQVRLS